MREFELAVERALDELPEKIAREIENVVVVLADEPTEEQLRDVGLDPETETALGLYEGTPITEREPSQWGGALPDQITIFRLPLLEACADRRELIREIRLTVIHEVGHYFGFDEDALP